MECTNVIDAISELLDSGKHKEALKVPNEEKYVRDFTNNCSDIISVVISKIQDNTIILKPSLYGACEELLMLIVEKATPEEALLEFIEQIEVAKNDAQFSIILTPLQQLLKKLSLKRGRSLEWCLNSISSYIESIPVPDYYLEGQEHVLMDCDSNLRRIINVYSTLPPFYKPFITELNGTPQNKRTKEIIIAFLVSLLGNPMIYVDLDPDTNTQSEMRQCCSKILQDICSVEKDVLKFLIHVEICFKENQKSNLKTCESEEEEKCPYENRDKINLTTLSGLYYAVYSGHFEVPDLALPQVYSIEYVVHTIMLLVVNLFNHTEYGLITKGVAICKNLLKRLPDHTSHTLLSSSVHYSLSKCLINIAIFSNYESLRKSSIKLIENHINKFNFNGRCVLIKYMMEIANHSGMVGYAITLYKNSINEAFKGSVMPECFTGEQLTAMVKKICYLPFGAESDLVELADQIITALNFLRYLTIKDMNNITGISDSFTIIETEYLCKLRTALNMSKAHYEVKLKDLEEGRDQENVDMSINVSGNILDKIPTETFRSGNRYILAFASISTKRAPRIVRNYSHIDNEKEVKIPVIPTEKEEQQYENNVKNNILEKALDFVPKNGWTVEALSAGAKVAGYPTITHSLFPNGGGDLVHYFNVRCNEQLVEQMKIWPKEELKDSKVPTKFIENAIMTRLLMIEPYRNTWPKAMAIQTLPNNVPNCLASLLSLVDDICYHSGDRSVDFNWYIRRVGLAGIYKAAELFYLTDSSQEHNATRHFVASRIRDAQLIQTALNMNPVSAAPQTLSAAFVTAKNMLGINTLK